MNTFKKPLAKQTRLLTYFYERIAKQKRLLSHVQLALPEHIAQQVQHCLIKGDVLFIYTDASTSASIGRFHEPTVLNAIMSLTETPVKSIQFRLMIETVMKAQLSTRKVHLPSENTIATFSKDSLSVQDEALKEALLKLSNTLAKLRSK